MTKISVFLLCTVGLAVFGQRSFGAPTGEWTVEDLEKYLESVPEHERRYFIIKQIDIGYKVEELKQSWPDEEEANLAVKIFNRIARNQEIIRNNQKDILADIYREQICFPDPIGCFDPDDPPIRPE